MEQCGWFLLALTAFFGMPALFYFPRRQLRPYSDRCPVPASWPRVSVIVAAKDEAESVETALRGLLLSDYPQLEIVFVNDRSIDQTGVIADRLAAQDSRLTVVHLTELPPGWLGKCNAMAQAAQRASGEYLLFTDGDVLFTTETIRRSMRYVLAKQLDHFCVLPGMITRSYWERVIVTTFGVLFLFGSQPWFRKLRLPQSYYGIGAFNLVKRSAYDQIGGHEPIKLDVCDDVKLGKLLFQHRCSADFLLGGQDVQVRWQDSAWGVIRGLEKNAFAAMDYSVRKLIGFSIFYTVLFIVPYASCPWWSVPAGRGYAAAFVLLHVVYARLAIPFQSGVTVVPAFLFGAFAVLFAFWNSAFRILRQGGVRWRETFYPLDDLRRGLHR